MSKLSERLREMAQSTVLCEEEYEDLLAAAEALEAAEWRPIAEAPKDGTRVEVFGLYRDGKPYREEKEEDAEEE